MPIAREGQFLVTHDLGITSSLGMESSQLEACLREAQARPYHGVFGFPRFGFREDNLDFLRRLPWLQQVWFWDVKLRSVEGLYAIEHLRYFGVHPKRPGIDFARFQELETVIWTYNARDRALADLARLQRLHVWHYNPKQRTFRGMPVSRSIEELEINWANPDSLEGIPELARLRRLGMARCRNLKSVESLPEIAPNLEWLRIESSGRLSSAVAERVIAQLPKLRHAFVQDRLLVGPERPAA